MRQGFRTFGLASLAGLAALASAGCQDTESLDSINTSDERGLAGVQTDNVVFEPTLDTISLRPEANPERNAYFGDLHVHTEYSFDAYAFGSLATPRDAYRYAKGDAIPHPAGYEIQLGRPLDFYAVTDHAMFLGVAKEAGLFKLVMRNQGWDDWGGGVAHSRTPVGCGDVGIWRYDVLRVPFDRTGQSEATLLDNLGRIDIRSARGSCDFSDVAVALAGADGGHDGYRTGFACFLERFDGAIGARRHNAYSKDRDVPPPQSIVDVLESIRCCRVARDDDGFHRRFVLVWKLGGSRCPIAVSEEKHCVLEYQLLQESDLVFRRVIPVGHIRLVPEINKGLVFEVRMTVRTRLVSHVVEPVNRHDLVQYGEPSDPRIKNPDRKVLIQRPILVGR